MGLKVKLRRIELGIKQKDLAEKIGVTQQHLGNLESGRCTNPSRDLMIKIAKELNTTVQELFFSED